MKSYSYVNGWPIISRLLCRRGKNQSDLARLLGITPAAVTQFKHWEYQLSGPHLEKILVDLNATPEDCSELYSRMIPARLFGKSASQFTCQAVIRRIKEE